MHGTISILFALLVGVLTPSSAFSQNEGQNDGQATFDTGQFKQVKTLMGRVIQLEVVDGRLRLTRNWQNEWAKLKNEHGGSPEEICLEFQEILSQRGMDLPEALATRILYFLYQQQEKPLSKLEKEFCSGLEYQEKNRRNIVRKRGPKRRPPMLHLEHGESNPNFLALDATILMMAKRFPDRKGQGSGGSSWMRRTRFHSTEMCGECCRLGEGEQLRFNFFENQAPFRRFTLSDHVNGDFLLRYSKPDLTIELKQNADYKIRMVVIKKDVEKVVTADSFSELKQTNPQLIRLFLKPLLQSLGISLLSESDSSESDSDSGSQS